ncbi:DUF4124 domain-containing protein [Undibacterium sp. RTI2.1]|uniref:DUF4124 domain-containing protein n=1 Tax=unclassified Undibacterium TaxID=2630295 RepID=UPI002AB36AE4|nr:MULTISPECIES: DUF4124 domain-containing protein [unclassified Undibacterium]MDY7540642.1 DUF4124 domain-containing protein [Undibacterium sp. 5I1]MEB0029696.1 DUF4124 domain-containing protein [Undibacterium sp. RTI2.1]MEB0117512.1 DUF4124 domain-containing protein [Undibacterium sp. RTI2.2]MEB0230818.1 DUF4124 domain-containing protein [Undibacterium sp. 10I3]MEB0256607.1 DUF4124 domain-containing protein [Undibacterium sp. 5I1]
MNRLLSGLALLAVFFAPSAHADADVFLCVDANGNKEYKNTGETKGCKRVELPGITVVPAPAFMGTKKTASKSASSPSDFPKVDESTQKARDSDRKQILQDELKTEEQKLAALKKDYNNGEPERRGDERNYAKYQERTNMMKDDISRTEKNIEALKRELSNLK